MSSLSKWKAWDQDRLKPIDHFETRKMHDFQDHMKKCLTTLLLTLSMWKHLMCPLCSGLVIAMVVSLIFIVLLRFLAGVMVWVMIVLVILVIGYGKSSASVDHKCLYLCYWIKKNKYCYLFLFFLGIFHCFMEFRSLKEEPGADVTIRDLGLQTDFSVYLQIRQTWLAFSTHKHT